MSWADKGVPSVLREGKDEEQYRKEMLSGKKEREQGSLDRGVQLT